MCPCLVVFRTIWPVLFLPYQCRDLNIIQIPFTSDKDLQSLRPCLLTSRITLSLGTFLELRVGHQEQKPSLDLQERNKLGSLVILKQDAVRL